MRIGKENEPAARRWQRHNTFSSPWLRTPETIRSIVGKTIADRGPPAGSNGRSQQDGPTPREVKREQSQKTDRTPTE